MRAAQPRTQRLDVRPLLARGDNVLAAIRQVVDRLQPAQRLEVTAPFLPSPLIERLGSEGFRSEVKQAGAGVWTVAFWRDPD